MNCLSLCLMAAALGQAPAQGELLDAVPPGVDVVLHVRGLAPARDDLVAMLRAASARLAAQAEPAIDAGLAQVREHIGDAAATPFVIALRVPPPQTPGRPVLVVLRTADYEGFLKGIADNKDVVIQHGEGGIDSFPEKTGGTLYAAKSGGLVGFGSDRALVAAFAKPGGDGLGKSIAPELRARLLAGDAGAYVNLAAITGRFKDQLAQARRQMEAGFDQAAPQIGGGAMVDLMKSIYGGMFDAMAEADALALSLDLAADGATLDGLLALKPGSKMGEALAEVGPGNPGSLGKLPPDASSYAYMNLDARSFEAFQKLTMGLLIAAGKPTPELDAALAKQRAMGKIEVAGAMTMERGMQSFYVYTLFDPKAFLAAVEAMMKATKASDSPLNFFKDITYARGAETYAGYTFDRVEMTVDAEKVDRFTAGDPARMAQMKGMLGGGKVTSWYGVGPSRVIQVTATDWDRAKAQIDAYQNGERTIGATRGFREGLAKLPKEASVIMLLSVQGLVRQVAAQLGGPPVDDLPKDPVLVGLSLSARPRAGYAFRLVLPSAMGPIIEKRMGGAAPGPALPNP